MFIGEVIGTGEAAIADERSSKPTREELVRIAHETYLAFCSVIAPRAVSLGLVLFWIMHLREMLEKFSDIAAGVLFVEVQFPELTSRIVQDPLSNKLHLFDINVFTCLHTAVLVLIINRALTVRMRT